MAAPGVDPVTAQAQPSPCFQPTRTRALRDVAWSTDSFCPAASGCVAMALGFTESLTPKARGRAAWQGQGATLLRAVHAEPQVNPVGEEGDDHSHLKQRKVAAHSRILTTRGGRAGASWLGDGTQTPRRA